MSRKTPLRGGYPCPTDPDHGPLYDDGKGGFYCIHADHDGRPSKAPRGFLAQSSPRFTYEQVKQAMGR